jgi:hypothetical protein
MKTLGYHEGQPIERAGNRTEAPDGRYAAPGVRGRTGYWLQSCGAKRFMLKFIHRHPENGSRNFRKAIQMQRKP